MRWQKKLGGESAAQSGGHDIMISPLGKAGGDLTGTGVIVDVTGRPIMQEENSGKVVRDKN